MMFELIEEASSVPLLDLKASYERQNEVLKRARFLYNAFEGIGIDDFDRYKPPVLVKGSVCMFCYSLFELKSDVALVDNNKTEGERYIRLKLSKDGKALTAEIVDYMVKDYSEELGGFYHIDTYRDGEIYKYINYYMHYKNGFYNPSYLDNYEGEIY